MSAFGLLKMKSGVYRCKDDIKNFKIRVKLKKLNTTIPNIKGDADNGSEKEEKIFSWQQKVLSNSEIALYSKAKNCSTDLEKEYHRLIKKSTTVPSRLFSYVQTNKFCQADQNVTTEIRPRLSKLNEEMLNLTLNKSVKDVNKTINVAASNSTIFENAELEITKSLNNCIANPYSRNPCEFMMIMADLGNSDAESKIWLKSEHMLCLLKYNYEKKNISIFPDFSKNLEKPYVLEIDVDGKIFYEFTLEDVSNYKKSGTIIKHTTVLEKIVNQSINVNSEILGPIFVFPPRNVNRVFLFFEILTVKNFENDNIYVQYNIDLPENWSTSNALELYGTTQTCKTKGLQSWGNLSYYFDVSLDYTIPENEVEGIPTSPSIYFQVISRDIWNRYRTEGLTYKCIPVFNPGMHTFELQCLRVLPKSPSGDLRRYFVGDYGTINNLSWISIPTGHKGTILNKYGVSTIGTGTIDVRVNVINQSKSFEPSFKVKSENIQDGNVVEQLKDLSLNKTVSNIIDAYKKAKANLIESRMNITIDE